MCLILLYWGRGGIVKEAKHLFPYFKAALWLHYQWEIGQDWALNLMIYS